MNINFPITQPLTLGKYNNAPAVDKELRNTSIGQHNTKTNQLIIKTQIQIMLQNMNTNIVGAINHTETWQSVEEPALNGCFHRGAAISHDVE